MMRDGGQQRAKAAMMRGEGRRLATVAKVVMRVDGGERRLATVATMCSSEWRLAMAAETATMRNGERQRRLATVAKRDAR